jgi:dinuclear metal center YbgI/SA1388 family protein
MARLDDIVHYLNSHLEVTRYRDAAHNGLQVEGAHEVQRVALGVSASLEFFEKAQRWGAQALVVHHGLFWGPVLPVVGPLAGRLRCLLTHELSLLAYHLPLDAHEEDGNNVQLAQRLELTDIEPWGDYHGQLIGCQGRLPADVTADQFVDMVADVCETQPVQVGQGRQRPQRIAICSGGGGSLLADAIEANVDIFLTGEPGEPAQALARESGLLVVGAGHYNSERLGVQRLGARLEEQFNVETRFIDVANPL